MIRHRLRARVLSLAGLSSAVITGALLAGSNFKVAAAAGVSSVALAPARSDSTHPDAGNSDTRAPKLDDSVRKITARPAERGVVYEGEDSLAFRELVSEPTSYSELDPAAPPASRGIVHAKLLAFNDFHGNLSTDHALEGRPLGGAAVLSSYLRAHSVGFEGRSAIVQAGDLVGASPAESALFQDEPSVAFFSALSNGRCGRHGEDPRCNLIGILGNHEFDEGTAELLRLVRGGNRAKGAFLGAPFRGAGYPILCANLVDHASGRPLFPAHVIKQWDGVKVGFVGAVLSSATWFLVKSGISNVEFKDEAESINASVKALKAQGVHAVVVVIHQGARQRFGRDLARDASSVSGELAALIPKLDGEVDVVISGHSHSALSALVPNGAGRPTLLTQAFHSSTAFADIELDIDVESDEIVRKQARIITTFADDGPGKAPDAAVAKIVRQALREAAKVTSTVVGRTSAEIARRANQHGESPMGDLVADAQRAALKTDLAFTTPAWVRAGLGKGIVTWGDLFTVQPFGNRLTEVELLGSQVIELLNQQWEVESYSRMLHISGMSYRWDGRRAPAHRVVDVSVNGQPLELNKRYTAAVNEFLVEGGEGFSVLAGIAHRTSPVVDIDALVQKFRTAGSIEPRVDGRIRRVDID
ncbi:MAG TPA: bifunctional metallophosphatase/5'-nucleotidase [Polyangiaceae bacterium]